MSGKQCNAETSFKYPPAANGRVTPLIVLQRRAYRSSFGAPRKVICGFLREIIDTCRATWARSFHTTNTPRPPLARVLFLRAKNRANYALRAHANRVEFILF